MRLARLPIRVRVTLAFTVVMAIVLAAVGAFLYQQLGDRLDESVDETLETRAAELTGLIEANPNLTRRSGYTLLFGQEDSFTELLTPAGRLIASSRPAADAGALSAESVAAARRGPSVVEHEGLAGVDGRARLLAFPIDADGRELVAVVGASLSDRDEALASLAALLAIGLPAVLLLASLAGYLALASALRPVDAMRRRAAAISASERGERLPVPVARDELSRLGRTLNEMLARLEAALERERRFVDDASHELRTPLALQRAELEVALAYGSGERELRAAIGSAIEEVDRLVQLAEDLLVVARAEEGKLAVATEPLSVSALLAAVAERFRARAQESRRALVLEAGDGLLVEADRLRLEQALTSLVDNALRHGEGEVRIWARANGDRVELHVSDRGPGFPPEFIDRAFERFSRADPARARGGSGLGLAIVETIARAHGGRARALNDPGGGADVWIEVPSAS